MKRILGALAGLTLVAAAAAPVAAQNVVDARVMRFGVQGGISMPTGDFGDAANMGFLVGGLLDFMPAGMPIGVRVNVDYNRWGAKDEVSDFLEIDNFSVLSATVNALLAIQTGGGIAPYAIGGVGMYRSSCSPDCEASNDFGFNIGGGLNFGLGAMDTGVEVRYHKVDDSSFITIPFIIRF